MAQRTKEVSSYIAQYPILSIPQSAHFTVWQTCSIEPHLGFSWKHTAMLHLMREDYSYKETGIAKSLFI